MISVGSRTESVKKFSEESLLNFIRKQSKNEEILQKLIKIMLEQVKLHRKYERIGTPLFKTIAILFQRKEIYELPGIAEVVTELNKYLK